MSTTRRNVSLIALLLLALAPMVLVGGCGGDGEEEGGDVPENHPILGTWVATSVTRPDQPDAGDGVVDDGLNFSMNFSANGEYSYLSDNDDPTDPWICEGTDFCEDWGYFSVSGSSLVLDPGTADEGTYTFTIADDTLTLTDTATGGLRIVAERSGAGG